MLWEKEAQQFGADPERVQVWDALSQFYLDTSQDAADLERIAQVLARSPFSIDELRHIERMEVEPTCIANLFCVAGEWAGFAPDWLIPRCLRRQQRHPYRPGQRPGWLYRLIVAFKPSNIPSKRIEEIRSMASRSDAD